MSDRSPVAVLLATYNGGKYISEFLESLLSQTYKNFVLFIRDDGSSDDTLDIIHGFVEKIEIKFVSGKERLGPARSFMSLLNQAGDGYCFYAFADQDDFWEKDKLERALNLTINDGNYPVLYCSAVEYVNEGLKHIAYSNTPRYVGFKNALVENIATGCTIVINNKARHLILDHQPKEYTMHDWWMYLVVSAFGKIVYDNNSTIKYRQHGKNTIGVVTNVFANFIRRFKRYILRSENSFGIAKQAQELKLGYSDRLPSEYIALVEKILIGKKSRWKRLSLCLFQPCVRQSRFDDVVLRFLFLSNRY